MVTDARAVRTAGSRRSRVRVLARRVDAGGRDPAGKLAPHPMLIMLIDTSDPRYGGGSQPSRGRVRRMLAGGVACLVLADFLPVLGAVLLATVGLLVLVLALWIVDDDPPDAG